MATSQSKTALRAYRRENGLCIHCGVQADRGTRCSGCAAKDQVNRKRYQARDKAAGVCVYLGCSNTTDGKHVSCKTCRKKRSDRDHANREAGLCVKCSKPASPSSDHCQSCRAKRSAYMTKWAARRVAEGRCRRCGDFRMDTTVKMCPSCMEKSKSYHYRLKDAVVAAYGGPICVGCGEDEIRILQIDHIAGGGNKHANEIGGRSKIYKWLRDNNYPAGFRVLCPSCNVRAARGISFPNPVLVTKPEPAKKSKKKKKKPT